ncbi:MAG: hypothetical protein HYX39_08340 [Bacteroidetes bacterium]|nr:hypothetical protein [Bacteroidota bacterium]
MTPEQFKFYWLLTYPDSVPLPHLFRHFWPEQWFRIHSLPQSKRYAETQEEWEILLERQNTIISDLLANAPEVFIITGSEDAEEPDNESSLKNYKFINLPSIDLHKIYPNEYEKGELFTPSFTAQQWKINQFNDLLKNVAEDKLRAFFLSVDNQCLIAPYDGGVDIILKDAQTKERFKLKYKDWLSERPDGL